MTPLRTLFLIAVAGLLAGCAQGVVVPISTSGPHLQPADMPNLMPGEYFTYDNGERHRVTRVAGGRVDWESGRDASSSRLINPLVPDLTWENRTQRSVARIDGDPELLWPLRVGDSAGFSVEQTITRLADGVQRSFARDWACRVSGTEFLTVPAGRFDTYVVTCTRHDTGTGALRGTRVLWYAPELAHVVQGSDRSAGGTKRERRLVSHGFDSRYLPREEQRAVNRLLVEVLNQNPDGVPATWRSDGLPVGLILVPLKSYESGDGVACRTYRSIYSVQGRIHRHERDFCRSPDGRGWRRKT